MDTPEPDLPRIPYITDAQAEASTSADVLAAIRQRRGGQLVNLDRILLHSPPVAEGWGPLLGRLRGSLELPPLLRELAMCAVAVLNGAEYEFHHHGPLYLQAGASEAQLQALRDLRQTPHALDDSPLFDPVQRAVLMLVVQSTRQVQVAQAVFDAARAALGSDRLMLELVTVTAAYNMVSRVLVAFDVQPEEDSAVRA